MKEEIIVTASQILMASSVWLKTTRVGLPGHHPNSRMVEALVAHSFFPGISELR